MLDASPKNISGYFGLARSFAEGGQDKKALDMLGRAAKLGLEDKVDVQKIHDIINGRKIKKGILKSSLDTKKAI